MPQQLGFCCFGHITVIVLKNLKKTESEGRKEGRKNVKEDRERDGCQDDQGYQICIRLRIG
jgi:hypothetical protein